MKVGITGHQHLGSEETISWISSVLESVIDQSNIDVGITSLAVGADQLFAEVLKKKHIRYIVIIPSDEYEKTFKDRNHVEKYRDLLHSASDTMKMSFPEPSETAFYAAGKEMVNLADLIIAIWDGRPAKGLGGTADIVQYTCSIRKKVIHINPATHCVNQL